MTNNSNCTNFCTAAKCEELKIIIGVLQQDLVLLKAGFEAHTKQSIPTAHDSELNVNVETDIYEGTLIVDVAVGENSDLSTIKLPTPPVHIETDISDNTLIIDIAVGNSNDLAIIEFPAPPINVETDIYEGTLIVDVTVGDNSDLSTVELLTPPINVETDIYESTLIVDVTVGENSDLSTVELPTPPINVETDIYESTLIVDVTVGENSDLSTVELPTPPINVETDIYEGTLIVDVAVGENSDLSTVELPTPPINVETDIYEGTLIVDVAVGDNSDLSTVELPTPPINVETDIYEGTLIVDVAVGDNSDLSTVELPAPNKSNLKISGSFSNNNLYLIKTDGENQDTTTIEIDMNCDEIKNIIIAEIEDSENNIINKIDGIKNELVNDLLDIKKYVTVDISGTALTEYQCKFVYDDNEKIVPGYAESRFTETEYSGIGLAGIHENFKLVNANLDKLHSDVCKAVDPISTLTIDDLYKHCLSNEIDRSNYESGDDGDDEYEEAVAEYLYNLLIESKYGYLVENAIDGKLITAPNNWITPILADFGLVQSRINNTSMCAIKEAESNDVVSIVANETVIPKAEGKFLILHFVELNDYPKRSINSSYWQIQIPAAKESYDWDNDFKSLRWRRGNQYAELRFEEFKNPVSGFFKDEEAANDYFDAVLNLTTATEKNRVIPLHSNPKNTVTQRETRPYRAFIESVNEQGQPVCHLKYVPLRDET